MANPTRKPITIDAKIVATKVGGIAGDGWQHIHDRAQARARTNQPAQRPPAATKTAPPRLSGDAFKAQVNGSILALITDTARMSLKSAGVGFDGSLNEKAQKIAAAALPLMASGLWAWLAKQAGDDARAEIAKRADLKGVTEVDVHTYVNELALIQALSEHTKVVVAPDGSYAAVMFADMVLKSVSLVPQPTGAPSPIQVDVHVPAQLPAQVYVQNDVHVPQQAAPVVNVQTPAPFQPSRTEIEYEVGPDGKQRPRAVTRR
jgi:hypothetical protein